MNAHNRKVTIEFELGDMPMIFEAFRLASTTAMCCGNQAAQKTMNRYAKTIEKFVPVIAAPFDEFKWSEIMERLKVATSFSVYIEKPNWNKWAKTGYAVIEIAGKAFHSNHSNIEIDGQYMAALEAYLTEMAPLDTTFIDKPKETQTA